MMNERRKQILKLVNNRGVIRFGELMEAFPDVSEMTLRKDLKFLDGQKTLVRIHGGARSLDNIHTAEIPLSLRLSQNIEQKYLIGQKANGLIKENSIVFIDSGSTSVQLARVFTNRKCTVFTTSLSVAISLCDCDKVDVYLFGGKVKGESLSIRGARALNDIANLRFDIAFLSCSGYIESEGFNTKNEECWTLEREVVRRCKKNVVLMDSSKLNAQYPYIFAKAEEIQVLVSDDHLSKEVAASLKSKGISVL